MSKDIQLLELTAFAFYLEEDHPSILLTQWSPYEEIENCVILSSSEYSTQIVLYAYHGAVTDLQLLSLELEDVDEDGSAHFKQSILETIPRVEPGSPVVLQLEFGCSIPNFGVRYTDNKGDVKAYSIIDALTAPRAIFRSSYLTSAFKPHFLQNGDALHSPELPPLTIHIPLNMISFYFIGGLH